MTEVVVVALIGVVLGVAGNAVTGRGLRFTHDYFPSAGRTPGNKTVDPGNTAPSTQPNVDKHPGDINERIAQHLRELDLQPINFEEAKAVFEHPEHEAGGMMFVDARKEKSYREGHIPGAYLFDRFRAEDYIAEIKAAASMANQIIVYCGGGECEDSEQATVELQMQELDPTLLYVYIGGMEEWQRKGMPVERGERYSGDIIGGGQ